MSLTVNASDSGVIKPAQDYIAEGDALSRELEKLADNIEEKGLMLARLVSSIRANNKLREDRRNLIASKFTSPDSDSYQKSLAGQERAAKLACDADQDLIEFDHQIMQLQEIRDTTEAELNAANKRHAGLVARQSQISHILQHRAAQLDYVRVKNNGQPKTVNINI